MNFRRGRAPEQPEINLIPMIDVLLVVLIFLLVTTTYSRFRELQINLPRADARATADQPQAVQVGVDARGAYAVGDRRIESGAPEALAAALRAAAGDDRDPVIVINADAKATHESVIRVLEVARRLNYPRITFATQQAP